MFHLLQTIEAAIREFQMETRNLITTQQRMLSATPTGLQHLGGNVTPNSGTPKTGRTVSQQDIRMMLGRGMCMLLFSKGQNDSLHYK